LAPIVASAALLALAALAYRPRTGTRIEWPLLALRAGVLAALGLALVGSVFRWGYQAQTRRVVLLVDQSASMADAGTDTAALRLAEQLALPPGFRREIAVFADSLLPLSKARSLDRDRTRIPAALRASLRSGPDAVVVLSDGLDNSNEPGAASSVPVYAVGVGSAARLNLAITAVSLPSSVVAGETTVATVRVLSSGAASRRARVRFGRQDADVALSAGTSETEASFRVVFARPGTHVDTASVESLPGEAAYQDNQSVVTVRVRPSRYRVLFLTSSPGPNSRFLTAALRTDERVELLTAEAAPDSAGVRAADVFVLDQPDESRTGRQTMSQIAGRVESGAGALVLAGPGLRPGPALSRLLIGQLTSPAGGAYQPALTPEGRALPWFGDMARMPPFTQLVCLQPGVPGASVWLEAGGTGAWLMHEQSCASGRVVYCAGYPLWRWGFGPEPGRPGALDALLSGLVRYLAESGSNRSRLEPARDAFRADEPARLEFRALAADGSPWTGLDINLTTRAAAGVAVGPAVPMTETGPGVYGVNLSGLAPGRYAALAVARLGDSAVGQASAEFAVLAQRIEQSRTGRDDRFLRGLASGAGGEYWPLESLPARGLTSIPVRRRTATWDPRRSVWLYVAAALLTGAEIGLRRRKGLL
jgi:hypothetical protein